MTDSKKGQKRVNDTDIDRSPSDGINHGSNMLKKAKSDETLSSINSALPTYSDMISHAIRELGGASVVDITNFIADNYPQVLSQKTRNSVAGCLSANRRRIFVKLPVKKGAKRYIWKLRDMITNEDNLEDDDEEIDERTNGHNREMVEQETRSFVVKNEEEIYEENDKVSPKVSTPVVNKVKTKKSPSPPAVNGVSAGTVVLVKQALVEMGGEGTLDEITEFIVNNRKEFGVDKNKLHGMVQIALYSSQYNDVFLKEIVNDNISWKVRNAP